MNKITSSKIKTETGIDNVIELFIRTQKEINNTSAYRLEETEKRIKLFHKRDTLEHVLALLDIQPCDLEFDKYNCFKIK